LDRFVSLLRRAQGAVVYLAHRANQLHAYSRRFRPQVTAGVARAMINSPASKGNATQAEVPPRAIGRRVRGMTHSARVRAGNCHRDAFEAYSRLIADQDLCSSRRRHVDGTVASARRSGDLRDQRQGDVSGQTPARGAFAAGS